MEKLDCPRGTPPPWRNPRAELIGAALVLLWCAWYGVWLASGLQSVR